MERKFVNTNFSYIELVPVSNGTSWTLEAICREIANKYRVKNYNPDIVIVWIDLEKQACGSEGVAAAIRTALIGEGADPNRLCVCVPDRMTENLILADEQAIAEAFGLEGYTYCGDGQHGKHKLSTMFKAANQNYKETFHGVNLLKRIRLSRSANASESAAAFYRSISPLAACWWFS